MLIRCVLLLQGAGMYVYKTIIAFGNTLCIHSNQCLILFISVT